MARKNDIPDWVMASRKESQKKANGLWKWWYEGDIEKGLLDAMGGEENLFAKEWAHASALWFKGFRDRVKRGQVVGFNRVRVLAGVGSEFDQRLLDDSPDHMESSEEFAYFIPRLFLLRPMMGLSPNAVFQNLPVEK